MKKVLVQCVVSIFVLCFFIIAVFFVAEMTAEAESSEITKQDLSSCRKTYISEDNIGYTSKENEGLPFGAALTDLWVGSTTGNAFRVEMNSAKGIPVVAVDSAGDFVISVDFADKKKDDELYKWSTSERKEKTKIAENYTLSYDSWGATQTGNKQQTVTANGLQVVTGEIGTGAMVVQTSQDGNNWTNADMNKYANGLYTTNVLNYYHGKSCRYTVDGMSVKQGTYVSVSFFYEVRHEYTYYYTTQERYWYQHLLFGIPLGGTHTVEHYDDKSVCYNICEAYTFYVVEDNPEVVTFNNLTVADKTEIVEAVKPSSQEEGEYKIQSEQYENYLNAVIDRVLPTMIDGDMTTTGFRINMTANPYLQVVVRRNGLPFLLNQQKKDGQVYYEITQSGKYDITVTSYSKEKTLTVYVDRASADEAYLRYFGETAMYGGQAYGNAFLNYAPGNTYGNMRVFDAYSEIPVFAGTLTMELQELNNVNVLPLCGTVTNKSTGKVIPFDSQKTVLTEYGEYEVLLSTDPDYYEYAVIGNSDIQKSGDVRIYKFCFKLIGKTNGSTVNQQLLSSATFKDFSVASPSDYVPTFYGVKRSSANKGEVIIAFADRESALSYAKQVVWGDIETHIDAKGTTYWLIPNPENPFGAKIVSYSGWKNAQVVRELAEKMVEERHFDLTRSSSYLTLEKSMEDFDDEDVETDSLLNDLQFASLEKSVIVWYSTEQRNATIAASAMIGEMNVIKFIGKQNFAVLTKEAGGNSYSQIVTGERDYRFVRDALGIDSFTITARDALGNNFSLNYEEGLYAQLKAKGCCSGAVLLTETNVYGTITGQYYICYVEEGFQPTEMLFSADGTEFTISSEEMIAYGSYAEVVLKNVTDYLDPYTYVRVTEKSGVIPTEYYDIADAIGMVFNNTGDYEVSVIDRFGNCLSYEFSII